MYIHITLKFYYFSSTLYVLRIHGVYLKSIIDSEYIYVSTCVSYKYILLYALPIPVLFYFCFI